MDFFTDNNPINPENWRELVYRTSLGEVGFDADSEGKAFVQTVLRESWAFDRTQRVFYPVDRQPLNFHNLHNAAAVVAIRPREPLLTDFHQSAVRKATEKINALRARFGKDPLIVETPMVCPDPDPETRKIATQCIDIICKFSDACLLLRRSESGLTGAIFSQCPETLEQLIDAASAAAGISVTAVLSPAELPCW